MFKNNVTVLTVVPYEETPRKQDELTELLENAADLVSAVTDLTKNVKEMIEQKTGHIEQPSACACSTNSASSSFNDFKRRTKPPCLIDISKDVSVRYKSKDDTNVRVKGRIPAGSSCATDSLKKAFERKSWALKEKRQAKGIEGTKRLAQMKEKLKNERRVGVPRMSSSEKATQSEVPFESKYVHTTSESTGKSKEDKEDKPQGQLNSDVISRDEPVEKTEPETFISYKNETVKELIDPGSSSDSLSSQLHSQDVSPEKSLKLATQMRRHEQRAMTSKDEKRSRGRSKERKDRKKTPITSKIKVTVRQSSVPLLKRDSFTGN